MFAVVTVIGNRNANYRVNIIDKQYFFNLKSIIAEATSADFYLEDTLPVPQFLIWGKYIYFFSSVQFSRSVVSDFL